MRRPLVSLFIISILLTACVVPVATSEPSTSTPEISQFSTQTLTPFIAPTDTLVAATATETPMPTPVPSRAGCG